MKNPTKDRILQQFTFTTIDGRGEHETFRDCVTEALRNLEPGHGIHVIKDFEPFPMYQMMESKGLDKFVEKISEEEYHAYFFPVVTGDLNDIEMSQHIQVDKDKIKAIVDIKLLYLKGDLTQEAANEQLKQEVKTVNAQEFAIAEQYLQQYGVTDDDLAERIEEIFAIFEGVLETDHLQVPKGHPVRTYMDEVAAIRSLLAGMEGLLASKFIKNPWVEAYEKLAQINTHFARKQNQIYPALEAKGFDKPSRVMWTLENNIRDQIKDCRLLLDQDQDQAFLDMQRDMIDQVEDMMVKEMEILYPTVLDMLNQEDFYQMRSGDDEIGYCLIDTPPPFGPTKKEKSEPEGNMALMKDLSALLQKHGVLQETPSTEELDVSQGKLSLEQINLIFKHLSIDLSFVDENEIVRFYSDTKHRVFPRSPGVIGRNVQNCHPRESVHMVEEIIRAFRAGEQDQAEFWLEMGDKFIYIIYTAVRDDQGTFRGVLEMMQDLTRLRKLEGSQRLLSWQNTQEEPAETKSPVETKNLRDTGSQDSELSPGQEETSIPAGEGSKSEPEKSTSNPYGITPHTTVADMVKRYPYTKEVLLGLSPKFKKLNNPVLFKTMAGVATLDMVAGRGNLNIQDLIAVLVAAIEAKEA